MAISAETRLVALLGHPVAHSLSPRMQNAAFAARGLDWAYVALDVPPELLADSVRGLAASGFVGANVTAPHKLAAAKLCDEADAESDPLYDQAVEVVIKNRRASISLVQRHLRIGYNRAARLLEQMENSGVVSAMQSNGNRDILVPAASAE